MTEALPSKNLPILLGAIRQEAGNGELVLAQNDGERRLSFLEGELVHLRSDAAGEQFGNYLLRHGILDLPSLNDLLARDDRSPLGEKVVQWGMMSPGERDDHLRCIQEQILVHALEHPVLRWTWTAAAEPGPGPEPPLELRSRALIWSAFREFNDPAELLAVLRAEGAWKWSGRLDLLDGISDLPLTSAMAYAVSFLTADPVSFETFRFLSGLDEEEAGRLIATLWALGALALSGGELPSLAGAPVPPGAPVPGATPRLPFIMPPADMPFGAPKQRTPEPMAPCDTGSQPEFLGLDFDSEMNLDRLANLEEAMPMDLPPCGPRPGPRPEALPVLEDVPPCGPRPQARPDGPPMPGDMPPCGPRPAPRSEPLPVLGDMPPCGPRPEPQARWFQSEAIAPSRPIELDPEREGVPEPPRLQVSPETGKLFDRARRQLKLGHALEAVSTLEQALQAQPDGEAAYEGWLMLGRLRMTNPAWAMRAIHALKQASRIRPREAAPWIALGETHHRAGSLPEASACFRKARELDPSAEIPQALDPGEEPGPARQAKPPARRR
ncbi:MAG TPA: tetratricopeptide repeat protein [Holophaga sp.]|nr:tetratricopeptide repeat protein [Holophaga sp.]HPS67174.1 tetratricopeptide repeat protein [Holophaga sp.]